jgi:hypothetical protein
MCRKMETIACIGSNRFVPIARYTDRCTSDNTKRSLRLHNSTNVGSGVLVQDQSDRGEWSVPRLKSTFPARKAESLLGLIVSFLSSGIDADGIFSAAGSIGGSTRFTWSARPDSRSSCRDGIYPVDHQKLGGGQTRLRQLFCRGGDAVCQRNCI